MNVEKARFNMVEQQIKPWRMFDQRLLGAMATLPREKFIPARHKKLAYADIAIPLGHNQAMLKPREIARMIQALELDGEEKVLEIGCGSGYATALLAKLTAQVYSVDIISDFVKVAKDRLDKLALSNAVVKEMDATQGWLAHAPYDAILITSALPQLSDGLKKCLSADGKLVAILGTKGNYSVQLCQLDEHNEWVMESLFPIEACPMINSESPNQFVF